MKNSFSLEICRIKLQAMYVVFLLTLFHCFEVTEYAQDLTELFQEFGPLKHTSVVQENGVSKGFGFVKL